MMSLRLRHILAYSLAALLFVSTSGIPVQRMICLCKGEQVITWFSASDPGCCQKAPVQARPKCCTSEEGGDVSEKGNCQDQETTLARIYVQFLADKTIQTTETTQDIYVIGSGPVWISDPGLNAMQTIHPSIFQYLPAGPPLYLTDCQIRC
ncbi:MAG: hypothetical protein K9I85_02200 [Saprospiraceae bacterium]|nr:hypothetical protein [Saprospiraceae bacterium]